MNTSHRFAYFLLVGSLWVGSPTAFSLEPVHFRSQVAPILLDNCVACHGAKKAEGGYRIDTFAYLMQQGDSGAKPIVPSKIEESEIWRRIVTKDHSERMPADSEPLTAPEMELIKVWITEGASFDGERPTDPLHLVIPPATYPDPPAKYALPMPLTGLVMLPDGSQIVTGGYHELLCWNASDGSLLRRIKNVGERTSAIAIHPNGNQMAVASGTPGKLGDVRILDFATGVVQQVCVRSPDSILSVAFRPDGNRLAASGVDGLIRILDTSNYQELKTIASHADWVHSITWSADGQRLVSASRDKSVKVFTAETGDLLTSYGGHAASVSSAIFTADGKQVLSVGADKKLHRWEVEGAKKVAEWNVGEGFQVVMGTEFAVVPSADKGLHRIDLATNKESLQYQGHQDWVLRTSIHGSTNVLVSGSYDGELRIWNLADGKPIRNWSAVP